MKSTILGQFWQLILAMASIFILLSFANLDLSAAKDPPQAESLPGYYQFFMKSGQLVRIKAEVERDQKIAAGELAAVRMNKILPDLALPQPSGEPLSLNSYKGQKNLLLVSFRSWW